MRGAAQIFLAVLVAVVFSTANAQTAPQDFQIKVIVQHLEKKDAWKVTYRVSKPVTKLHFDRNINLFREQNWKSLNPKVKIVKEENKEIITSEKPFSEVSFQFPSYYGATPKDYEFFQAFSDKSVVMYTGHFNVHSKENPAKSHNEFFLVPRDKENIVVTGNVYNTAASWKESLSTGPKGTYVYFGNLKITNTTLMTMVVDPTLPKWLRKHVDETIPLLFSYYTRKFGFRLTTKPFLFLNYSPQGSGTSSHGGTLPGIVQMTLAGKGWTKENDDSYVQVARFFAHESAHLWNSQLFPYANKDMWMHEGGADAVAYIALHEVLNKSRLEYHRNKAFTECVAQLNNRPLRQVNEDPEYTAFYRCGSTFVLMTGAAVDKKDPSAGVFKFWNALFTESQKSKKPYTEEMYFKTLDKLADESKTSSAIKKLLDGPVKNAEGEFKAEFKRLNLSL